MFKTKSRFALLSAIVIVMAMGVMLVGNTFASDVDYTEPEVELRNVEGYENTDYNVVLKFSKSKGNSTYTPMNANNHAFDNSTLWCPGRTEIVYLEVVNQEEFPVDFTLSLKKADIEGERSFGSTLSYAAIDDDLKNKNMNQHPTSWLTYKSTAENLVKAEDEKDKENTERVGTLTGEHCLLYREPLNSPGAAHYLALAIHMDEKADSNYMNAVMDLQFVLTVEANFKPGETPAPATDKP